MFSDNTQLVASWGGVVTLRLMVLHTLLARGLTTSCGLWVLHVSKQLILCDSQSASALRFSSCRQNIMYPAIYLAKSHRYHHSTYYIGKIQLWYKCEPCLYTLCYGTNGYLPLAATNWDTPPKCWFLLCCIGRHQNESVCVWLVLKT